MNTDQTAQRAEAAEKLAQLEAANQKIAQLEASNERDFAALAKVTHERDVAVAERNAAIAKRDAAKAEFERRMDKKLSALGISKAAVLASTSPDSIKLTAADRARKAIAASKPSVE